MRQIVMIGIVGIGLIASTGCAPRDDRRVDRDRGSVLDGFDSNPNASFDAETHFAAGKLAESKGQFSAAIVQYQRAVDLNPGMHAAVYRLAVLHTQQRQYPKAIAAWKRYIELTGNSATAWSNLGYTHEIAGQLNEAEAAYCQAIQQDPTNQTARVNYALMLARQQRWVEARSNLAAVLPPAMVHYNIASVLEQLGKTDQARGAYQQALSIDPGFRDARMRLDTLGPGPTAVLGE